MQMRRRIVIPVAVVSVILGACATTDTATTPNADPHILAIAIVANQGEVDQGNAATPRATNPDVRAFAEMMVRDHTTGVNELRNVGTQDAITPTDNDITAALQRTTRETITNLGTYSGAEFDRQYMQTQINVHQWYLTALEQHLIPGARNAQLRTLLERQRGIVAQHLEQARAIRGRL